MKMEELGYNDIIEKQRMEQGLEAFEIGRVLAEHKERYVVRTVKGESEAEVTGNLRFSARSREDFPAVGDWVALIDAGPGLSIIHRILPRRSVLTRQAVGKFAERQVIAANIDHAMLVQAVDRDFNINRLERYLTICYAAGVSPLIVLTKTDLVDSQRLSEIRESIRLRISDVPVFAVSNETTEGYDPVKGALEKGKTYCLLGSSGVGKSTLINNLAGRNIMATDSISASTNKGRHVTTHRELTVIEGGGILIDNPGMREIGIADASDGLETAFDRLLGYAENCKFKDCTHTSETGCAVIVAVEQGEIDRRSYENFLKLEREKEHFDLSVSEKRKKDKAFGKMLRKFKDDMQQLSAKHDDLYKK